MKIIIIVHSSQNSIFRPFLKAFKAFKAQKRKFELITFEPQNFLIKFSIFSKIFQNSVQAGKRITPSAKIYLWSTRNGLDYTKALLKLLKAFIDHSKDFVVCCVYYLESRISVYDNFLRYSQIYVRTAVYVR